ncbi:isoprenyl transferase [bacterium]|nr:isoprenyl transferase [bacterium]
MEEREEEILKRINKDKLPKHIAIIMDGNGRWARQKGLPRIVGHKKGVETVRKVVTLCGELGISALTLYAFSTENWARPKTEIKALMGLLKIYLQKEIGELNKNNVKLRAIGRLKEFPDQIQELLNKAIEATGKNTGVILTLALNYGARAEIIDAIKKIPASEIEGLSEESFKNYLYTNYLPYPELLIRTSGEFRLSNFLLWQAAYTEIYITDILWPDFGRIELLKALINYQDRQRKFGGIL